MNNTEIMTRLLERKGPLWLPLLSGSMAPDLLPGDELYIETDSFKVSSGDIVVFYSHGKFFSHRILFSIYWRKTRYLLEKGDANYSATMIPSYKALGIVTKIKRDNNVRDLNSRLEIQQSRKVAFKSFLKLFKLRKW